MKELSRSSWISSRCRLAQQGKMPKSSRFSRKQCLGNTLVTFPPSKRAGTRTVSGNRKAQEGISNASAQTNLHVFALSHLFFSSNSFVFQLCPLFFTFAVPLLASEAKPISAAKLKKEKATWNVTRVKGQHLEGVMIPTIEDTVHPEHDDGESVVVVDGIPFDGENDTANDASETKPLMNGNKKPIYTA